MATLLMMYLRKMFYTTDMAEFIKVSPYRNSIYKKQFPTGTWLEVKGLALSGQLIEIDMEAHKAE
jgi:enamine deaminase RidA (YjgF/YER057c/UK114 family)